VIHLSTLARILEKYHALKFISWKLHGGALYDTASWKLDFFWDINTANGDNYHSYQIHVPK
jgi:hypothetical protein